MRKYYLDNIRWITVALVALYHVIYIFNSVIPGTGMPFGEVQYQDALMYVVYPWFMILLFIVSGMSARYYLEKHTIKEFIRVRTRKLLVPSTIGLLVIGWIQGYVNMAVGGAFETMPDTIPTPVMFFIMVLSGTGVLRFVQMLWLFSLLLALIKRFEKGKHLFGVVTVGEKGQIIIPAKARKVFSIKAGDQLVVLDNEGQGLALIKSEDFLTLADAIRNNKMNMDEI